MKQRGSHTTRLTAFLVHKGESLNSRSYRPLKGASLITGAKVVRKVVWQQISTGLTSGKYLKYGVKYLRKSSLRPPFRNAALIDRRRDSCHTFKSSGEAFARLEAHATADGFKRKPPKVFFIVKPTASFFNAIFT